MENQGDLKYQIIESVGECLSNVISGVYQDATIGITEKNNEIADVFRGIADVIETDPSNVDKYINKIFPLGKIMDYRVGLLSENR